MTLQETIVQDMQKAPIGSKRNALRVLVAEMQRGSTKELNDAQVVKIIKTCIKSENLKLGYIRKEDTDQIAASKEYLDILSSYLKDEDTVSIETVKNWITANIDFSKLPNKMAAMKTIMAQFKGRIDGAEVKTMLESM